MRGLECQGWEVMSITSAPYLGELYPLQEKQGLPPGYRKAPLLRAQTRAPPSPVPVGQSVGVTTTLILAVMSS